MSNASLAPQKKYLASSWQYYEIWLKIEKILYALPNYFESEIVVKGVNPTDLYAVGSLFSTAIEYSLVNVLNKTRNVWDTNNLYPAFTFKRQSQTFPDVLLVDASNKNSIIFGIELKAWYALSKEGEPSFRFKIDPDSCAEADLLVVVPWLLSEVTSGKPVLLSPFVELAKYAAECRNFYWIESRIQAGKNAKIDRPVPQYRKPYPAAKEKASDSAQDDSGNNFGRIARTGQGNLLQDYLNEIQNQEYLGIKIKHWIKIFKAIAEGRDDQQIDSALNRVLKDVQQDVAISDEDSP
ncbi:hypothetical protein [Iningainema tapete]|uniref:Restriction endonuclease n=1 Tax=Iningainema tapete BLCC-T55 TaxID=2748662 RepID=A0A8J6XLZ1_9CYAN|nr:hypothetical protein [Iningainema tapete]MBD2778854.1 hypothetical protein [Iningainema tapete BLCC-T55]